MTGPSVTDLKVVAKGRVSPHLYMAQGGLEARLPKLRGFLATHDFVKNADYRGLFGVSRSVALRELQRLANEGFVEMVGERGGARYVPRPGTLADRTNVNAGMSSA